MATYVLIRPVEGAVHSPSGVPQWQFPFDGKWCPITDNRGEPVPYEPGVAQVALSYFTPAAPEGEERHPLVTLETVEGALDVRLSQPQEFVDEETGEKHASVADLIAAVKARVTASFTKPKAEDADEAPSPTERRRGRHAHTDQEG